MKEAVFPKPVITTQNTHPQRRLQVALAGSQLALEASHVGALLMHLGREGALIVQALCNAVREYSVPRIISSHAPIPYLAKMGGERGHGAHQGLRVAAERMRQARGLRRRATSLGLVCTHIAKQLIDNLQDDPMTK